MNLTTEGIRKTLTLLLIGARDSLRRKIAHDSPIIDIDDVRCGGGGIFCSRGFGLKP